MYKVTIYNQDEKNINETDDEDELQSIVDSCLEDLESGSINSFTVSRLSKSNIFFKKPFWEKL